MLAAIAVVAVGGAALWLLHGGQDSTSPPLTLERPHGVADSAIPDGGSAPSPGPAVVVPVLDEAGEAPAAENETASELADRRLTPIALDLLWQKIYDVADAAVYGHVTQDDVLDLWLGLVDALDPETAQVSQDGATVSYPMEVPGVARATVHRKVQGEVNEFTVSLMLETAPGYYTGVAEDRATETSMQLHLDLSEEDLPRKMSLIVKNSPHYRPELVASRLGKEPVAIGGAFFVDGGGTKWRQITLDVSMEDGEPLWFNKLDDAVEVDDTLNGDDPRLGHVLTRLRAIRGGAAAPEH